MGKFKIGDQVKDTKDLTNADIDTLVDDFTGKTAAKGTERAQLIVDNPGLSSNLSVGFLKDAGTCLANAAGPCNNDIDRDGVYNSGDNCPDTYNPDQLDSEHNGIGDACRNLPVCDVNYDGEIDIRDINIILEARDTPAGFHDLRDADNDGVITTNDARICANRCTHPNCQP
jgi:hypothetical protein